MQKTAMDAENLESMSKENYLQEGFWGSLSFLLLLSGIDEKMAYLFQMKIIQIPIF